MTVILGLIGKEILEIRLLKDHEYNEFNIANNKLREFNKKQEYFKLVDTNYKEYKNVLSEYFKIQCENSTITGSYLEKEEMIFNANRLVLNFISSFYILMSHHEIYLKKTFGKESDRFKSFDLFEKSCFDTYFSYRFLYKLRNYSQHIGMPITGLEASSEIMNYNPSEIYHVLKAITFKDDLLKYDKWGKVKDEITSLKDKIDINPYIDELMYCIEKINAAFYEKTEFIELLKYTAFLHNLVEETKNKDGVPVIMHAKVIDDRQKIICEHFPFDAMESVDLLNLSSEGNPLKYQN